MSGSIGTESTGSKRGRGAGQQDFELNLASIIDCLTVLITFMLASASFLSIGILDAGIAAGGSESASTQPPPIQIVLELKRDKTITLKTNGKENVSQTISSKEGKRDHESLGRHLASIKTKWATVNAVTLFAENGVEYRDVIETMESTRQTMPVVLLGGF